MQAKTKKKLLMSYMSHSIMSFLTFEKLRTLYQTVKTKISNGCLNYINYNRNLDKNNNLKDLTMQPNNSISESYNIEIKENLKRSIEKHNPNGWSSKI